MTKLLDLSRAIQSVRGANKLVDDLLLNPRTYRERAHHYGVTATNS